MIKEFILLVFSLCFFCKLISLDKETLKQKKQDILVSLKSKINLDSFGTSILRGSLSNQLYFNDQKKIVFFERNSVFVELFPFRELQRISVDKLHLILV